jgi:hypothetical protein
MAIDAVAVVDRVQQFFQSVDRAPQFSPSDDSRLGYGLSIAGHVIIALLLMFGVLERIELFPVVAVPIEIVVEKPSQTARQVAPASSSAVSAPSEQKSEQKSEQNRPSGIPAVADDDKRAKAPQAALNLNGIDRPKQPGHDGQDASTDQAGIPVSPAPDGELASGGAPAPSPALVIAPIGPAPPQTTAREPGEDELTALKEQKVECGVLAKQQPPAVVTIGQARVRGFATKAQALAMIRSTQSSLDRHINPNYVGHQRVFTESLDGARKFAVLLPSGLSVNVGDVIQYDRAHLDPSDSCQYIPSVAVSKL